MPRPSRLGEEGREPGEEVVEGMEAMEAMEDKRGATKSHLIAYERVVPALVGAAIAIVDKRCPQKPITVRSSTLSDYG